MKRRRYMALGLAEPAKRGFALAVRRGASMAMLQLMLTQPIAIAVLPCPTFAAPGI